MKRKNTVREKTTAVALSLVMAVGLIPVVSKPLTVEAATSISSATTFATKEELMTNNFNLNGGTVKKVSFGVDSSTGEDAQIWYIAGYDSNAGNLVLMCDPNMPLIQSTTFCYDYPNDKFSVSDSMGLGIDTCMYTDGTQVEEVGMNHYGLSKLRTELKELETATEIFSEAEQGLMEETTIYTYDKYYYTTDKLYSAQAYCDTNSHTYYFLVGQNSEQLMNNGLKIKLSDYSDSSYTYWLRTPGTDYDGVNPNRAVNFQYGHDRSSWTSCDTIHTTMYAAVPAFALDLSSVLFASAVPIKQTIYNSAIQSSSDSWIFRLDDNNYGKIKSTIEYTTIETPNEETGTESELGVKVTKKKNDASVLYLCAQGTNDEGDWYFEEPVTETREISLNNLGDGATLDNCKVWIETTKDNVTYAKLAEEVSAPTTNVKGGTYTENQSIQLSTLTEGATIYYTTDGSKPNATSDKYTGAISVTGKQGDTVVTTINTITITPEGDESRVATYKYIIKLPHTHNWSESWTSNSTEHWHECTNENCTITDNNQKSGYDTHTADKGTVTIAPTATATGVKTYKCSVCGYVMRTETLSATPTTPVETPTETPTATPATKNTTLIATSKKCKVKVTSSSATNPTVAYMKSTDTKATTIKIPDDVTIDGVTYKVTAIEKNAFKNNRYIKKVTIGDNVKTIGANAFFGCKKLKTVKLGKNVTTIGDKAFYKCTKLISITIPSKVKKIGKSAFEGCKKLKTVTIKTKLLKSNKVGKKAFKGIKSNATIKVPKKKWKAYKSMLLKKGVGEKAKFKKMK